MIDHSYAQALHRGLILAYDALDQHYDASVLRGGYLKRLGAAKTLLMDRETRAAGIARINDVWTERPDLHLQDLVSDTPHG